MSARPKKLPHQVPPDAIRRSYYAELRVMVAWCEQWLQKHLFTYLPELLAQHGQRVDREGPPGTVNQIMREAKTAFYERFPQWVVQRVLNRYAKRAAEHNKVQLGKQVRAAIGVDISSVVAAKGLTKVFEDFAAANVALISTIPEQYFSAVEQTVLNGMRTGARAAELAEELEDKFKIAKDRAYLIARDQIGKLVGQLNKTRQTNLGVESFRWRGVNDERERDWHKEREGETYSWAEGVPESEQEEGAGDASFPGEAINCRCYPEPVFAGYEDDEEAEEP